VLRRASSLFAPRALTGVLAAIFIAVTDTRAAVEVLPERAAAAVFGGGRREIALRLRNSATTPATFDLRHRVFQASAALIAPLGDIQLCKSLTVGAGQTTLESFEVELPTVRSETLFQIAWFDGERKIGATAIRAFPDNLLQHLGSMVDAKPVGLVDPDDQIKAALNPVRTTLLKEAEDILAAEVPLILVGPMALQNRPAGLAAALKKKAASGTGIVWLQAPSPREPADWPPVFVVNEGAGHIVVANAALIADLSVSPRAQQSLIRLIEIAAGRRKLELPADTSP
jgi:hypothetical protein